MIQYKGPRRDSSAYLVLDRLHKLGGKASTDELKPVLLSHFRSTGRFNDLVVRPLLIFKFIQAIKGEFILTLCGRLFIESHIGQSNKQGQPTEQAYHAPAGTLDLKKHFNFVERRPGALGYREIPSMLANLRVLPNGEVIE